MEHFPIVQALCRSAIADPSPAVRRQVEGLRDELVQPGKTEQAATLNELLNPSERKAEIGRGTIMRSRPRRPGRRR